MSGPLTRSVARGAVWMGTFQVFNIGFRLVTTVIMARLLAPSDFGIVAMALIVTSSVSSLLDMGLGQALIQRKDITEKHLSTSFWLMLGMGVIACAAITALSPLVARFFKNEMVRPILMVSSVSFIICSLGGIHGALLRKKLEFFKFSAADGAGAVVSLATAATMAFAGFGYWSLVFAGIANNVTYVVLRWVFCRWHPSFTFSLSGLKDLWKFGFNVIGIRIVGSLNQQLDSIVIGRFLNTAALGTYNLGLKVVSPVSDNLYTMVSTLGFSAFSLIQDQDHRIRLGFLKSIRFVTVIGLPLFAGIALVSPELVRVIFGEKWSPAILPLQIICITAAVATLNVGTPPLIMSRGRPDVNLKFDLSRLLLLIPALLVGVRYGAVGVALGVLAVSAIIFSIQQKVANRLVGLSMREYFDAIRPAVISTFTMTIGLLVLRYGIAQFFAVPRVGLLVGLMITGAGIYLVTLRLIGARAFREITGLIREIASPYVRPAMVKLGLRREEALR